MGRPIKGYKNDEGRTCCTCGQFFEWKIFQHGQPECPKFYTDCPDCRRKNNSHHNGRRKIIENVPKRNYEHNLIRGQFTNWNDTSIFCL